MINVMHLNHSKTISHPHPTAPCSLWENCLPRNWPLVPKRLGPLFQSIRGYDLNTFWGDKIRPITESSTGLIFWTMVITTSSWSDLGVGAG